jgi:hypothetical protein
LDDEAIAKTAMQHGAPDFLLKERLDDYVLPKTLAAVIERARIAEVLFNEQDLARVQAVCNLQVIARIRPNRVQSLHMGE